MRDQALLDFSTPHVLRDAAEYDAAARAIDDLLDLDPEPGTRELDSLVFLSVLVRAYDEEHVRLPPATPQEIVDFALDQRGMQRSELAPILGGRSRVSEFFSGTRPLSIRQVRALREALSIPADALIA